MQQHARGAEATDHLVGQRALRQRNADQRLAGPLDALANRLGHFAGLAVAGAHDALAVADDDQRAEAEATAALHDLCDAIDVNDPIHEFVVVRIDRAKIAIRRHP